MRSSVSSPTNTRDANLQRSISRAGAHPPASDVGIQSWGILRVDLSLKLDDFRAYYNAYRVHRSLDGVTPAERFRTRSLELAQLDFYAGSRTAAPCFGRPFPHDYELAPQTSPRSGSYHIAEDSDLMLHLDSVTLVTPLIATNILRWLRRPL